MVVIKKHFPSATRVSRTRAAVSLTELLVVMTVASVIVGLSGMMIHRLLAAEHEATRTARFATSVARLSRAFRADVHAARDVELREPNDAQPATLVAQQGDGHEVRYELQAHRASRIETREGNQVHRDDFYFPPGSQLRFERGAEGSLVRLELELAGHRRDSKDDAPRRKLAIEAALARDHRFEPAPRQEGQLP